MWSFILLQCWGLLHTWQPTDILNVLLCKHIRGFRWQWHCSYTLLSQKVSPFIQGSPCHKPLLSFAIENSRVATNISHWLKVQSMRLKNYVFVKKCILISFGFSNIAFTIHSHLIIVPYFTLWMLDFFNTIWVSNSLDPDQARHYVGSDLGPNCLQRLSADDKSCQ